MTVQFFKEGNARADFMKLIGKGQLCGHATIDSSEVSAVWIFLEGEVSTTDRGPDIETPRP